MKLFAKNYYHYLGSFELALLRLYNAYDVSSQSVVFGTGFVPVKAFRYFGKYKYLAFKTFNKYKYLAFKK